MKEDTRVPKAIIHANVGQTIANITLKNGTTFVAKYQGHWYHHDSYSRDMCQENVLYMRRAYSQLLYDLNNLSSSYELIRLLKHGENEDGEYWSDLSLRKAEVLSVEHTITQEHWILVTSNTTADTRVSWWTASGQARRMSDKDQDAYLKVEIEELEPLPAWKLWPWYVRLYYYMLGKPLPEVPQKKETNDEHKRDEKSGVIPEGPDGDAPEGHRAAPPERPAGDS